MTLRMARSSKIASTQLVSQPGRQAVDGDFELSFKNELFAAGQWQVAIHALGHGRVVCH